MELRFSQELNQQLIDNQRRELDSKLSKTNSLVFQTDPEGFISQSKVLEFFPQSPQEAVNLFPVLFRRESDYEQFAKYINGREDNQFGYEFVQQHGDKYFKWILSPQHNESGDIISYQITATDQTKEIAQNLSLQQQIKEAHRDPLTGFQNRVAYEKKLSDLLSQKGVISMLYIDIDWLKIANDFGDHDIGDDYIKIASLVIGNILRPGDEIFHLGREEDQDVFRIGGDEFCVFLPGVADANAQHIRDRIYQVFDLINGRNIDNASPAAIKKAGIIMEQIKEKGINMEAVLEIVNMGVSIGIGYSENLGNDPNKLKKLISDGDKDLYGQKAERKLPKDIVDQRLGLALNPAGD